MSEIATVVAKRPAVGEQFNSKADVKAALQVFNAHSVSRCSSFDLKTGKLTVAGSFV